MKKLVKFTQTTCNPCNILEMMLKQMEVEVDESILIADDAELKRVEEEFGVMSTPTLVAFNEDGTEYARVVGINPGLINELLEDIGKL